MFKDKLVDGDDVDGRNRNDDNHSSPPLSSYIPPQSTTSYTKTVKRRGHQDGQTD